MLNAEQRKKAADVLDTYIEAMQDDIPAEEINNIKKISKEIASGSDTKVDASKPKEKPVKEKKKRAKTSRNIFMGSCMRKVENGGEGRPMGDCSTEWKELPQDIKDSYIDDEQKEA